MDEDCDVKPCEIKLESELILDDDYADNYSPGTSQEATNLVPDTDPLKSYAGVVLERQDLSLLDVVSPTTNRSSIDGDVLGFLTQIKVENTEDEDPLADAVPSDEWPIPSETAPSSFCKEEPTVFPEGFQIKLENDLLENNHRKDMSIHFASKYGDENRMKDSSSANGDMPNIYSEIGTEALEVQDNASDIGKNSHEHTFPIASVTSFHLDKQSPADSGKSPFPNNCCPPPFNNEAELNTELDSGRKPFACKHCPARFKRNSYLIDHLRIHSGEKPFSCTHCPARFNRKSSLNSHIRRHLRIHSGEKPFSCKHCPKRYNDQSNLRLHLRIHSGEQPFSCEYCPARFNQKSYLDTHLRIHSGVKPFSCKHCPARYNQKTSLNAHIRTHSPEKPFSCTHCSAEFSRKSDLTVHLRGHSGEKPFSCEHCLARFTQKK